MLSKKSYLQVLSLLMVSHHMEVLESILIFFPFAQQFRDLYFALFLMLKNTDCSVRLKSWAFFAKFAQEFTHPKFVKT